MDMTERVLGNALYIASQQQINDRERDRKFCRHDKEHCQEVARIACKLSGDEGWNIDKEVICIAALLHDIGRAEEYAGGSPHDEAGGRIAGEIMRQECLPRDIATAITQAIAGHRKLQKSGLNDILHRADKLSRACYDCTTRAECYWDDCDKNKSPY